MVVHQLLREWPPGYGGVERVAHDLGSVWGGPAFSFDVQGQACLLNDPLPVIYPRIRLRSTKLFGRLFLPLPSRSLILLLFSPEPLHGHLPSPGVLLLLALARLLRPRRFVSAHWHCFLDTTPGFHGCLFGLYQWIALRVLPCFSAVVTTSPVMSVRFFLWFFPCQCVGVPCSLTAGQEQASVLPLPLERG